MRDWDGMFDLILFRPVHPECIELYLVNLVSFNAMQVLHCLFHSSVEIIKRNTSRCYIYGGFKIEHLMEG